MNATDQNAAPDGSPDDRAAIAALSDRMGAEAFARRVRREQVLATPMRRFTASKRTNLAKVILASWTVRNFFRLCGLQRSGYRQYLDIQVKDHDVPLARLPPALDGFTILHLSDLHLDLDKKFVATLTKRLENAIYDLVVITGDFRNMTGGAIESALAGTIELRKHLRAPVYAVPGNHDVLAMIPPLERGGVRFLLNEHVVISRGDSTLVLAGVDDAHYFGSHDLDHAFAGAPADAPRVLLCHTPSVYPEASKHGVGLMLSGHTHGGQICLPGGFIVLRTEKCPRKFLRGPWTYENVRGYTSPGTGACGVALRFYCPPEAVLHHLRKA